MEQSKYYTPTREEVYPEQEIYFSANSEDPLLRIDPYVSMSNDNYVDIKHGSNIDNFRIKYLDREDIESFGWEKGHFVNIWSESDDIIDGFSIVDNNTDTYILFYDLETRVVGIYLQRIYNEVSGNWNSYIMFSGYVKNKSELRKVMSMLGIANSDKNT